MQSKRKAKEAGHMRNAPTWKIRLACAWRALTSRNFILIHDIRKEVIDDRDKIAVRYSTRTDYNAKSDMAALNAVYVDIYKKCY